jgi:2-succinyl-5-enolpyruvyl-6-hydroxy-3-cyclohexene-1-carboxylate synthase
VDAKFEQPTSIKPVVFNHPSPPALSLSQIKDSLKQSDKILVLVGQKSKSETLHFVLQKLQNKIPILADIVSKQHENGIKKWDISLLKQELPESLSPDLIITCGTSMLSKPLKQWLKKVKPRHIHLSLDTEIGNPFFTNPEHVCCFDADFLEGLNELITEPSAYLTDWLEFVEQHKTKEFQEPFRSEYALISRLMQDLGENDVLHLGNSMSVRYASWVGETRAEIYCNRGSSGIDGSLSTAVGHAMASPNKRIWIVLGDVSAVYDSNALWSDLPSNLTIIILNNGGGRIFDWIDGPNKVEGIRPYIHTPRHFDFEHLAKFYNVKYRKLNPIEIKSLYALGSGSKEAVLVEFEGNV